MSICVHAPCKTDFACSQNFVDQVVQAKIPPNNLAGLINQKTERLVIWYVGSFSVRPVTHTSVLLFHRLKKKVRAIDHLVSKSVVRARVAKMCQVCVHWVPINLSPIR